MKKLIVDTDCGIDDISAILIALESDVEIKAFTIVEGNVDITEGVLNAQRLSRMAQQPIPIFRGSTPLIQGLIQVDRWPGHGIDGLGGFSSRQEYKQFEQELFPGYKSIPVSNEHASIALVRLVNECPNELDLIALGPLTNIGLAIKLDPQFLQKLKSCYIMGGCVHAKGNSNNTAEFNIHYDPEAAHIVFEAALRASKGQSEPILKVIPWETTLEGGFEWSFMDTLKHTKRGAFLDGVVEFARRQSGSTQQPGYPKTEFEEHIKKMTNCVLPDVTAMISYLCPEAVLSFQDWNMQVELHGYHTRGATHLQWLQINDVNARVILKMDSEVVRGVMKSCLQ